MSPPKIEDTDTGAGLSRKGAGTDSFASGMSGGPLWLRWMVFALGAGIVQTLDVWSLVRALAAAHDPTPLWRVAANGYASVSVVILTYPAIRALCVAAHPWDRRPLRLAAIHGAGLIAFWAVHMAGMATILTAVYPLAGATFDWTLADVVRELPRDALTYVAIVAIIWLVLRLEARALAPQPVVDGPTTFDIRDGSRVIRVRPEAIIALRSAGNYVEVLLADGRRPLMRATLAAVEQALLPLGFVRIHRTCIVNRARVTGLSPAGSGDLTVTLDGGIEALLSRRYRREAEPRLTASPAAAQA